MTEQTVQEARTAMWDAWRRLDAADDPAEHRAALSASDAAETAFDKAVAGHLDGSSGVVEVDMFHNTVTPPAGTDLRFSLQKDDEDWFAIGPADESGHGDDDSDVDVDVR